MRIGKCGNEKRARIRRGGGGGEGGMAVKVRVFRWKILMNNSVFSLHPN
jgi:hypothetical protein